MCSLVQYSKKAAVKRIDLPKPMELNIIDGNNDLEKIMKTVFTPQEIAQLLHVVPTTIYAELKRGKLRHIRVGRKYIITKKHLEDYLSPDVARELLGAEVQPSTLVDGKKGGTAWLDATAEDMAVSIASAEAGVPAEELQAWYQAMEAAAKPLEANDGES